MKRVANLLALIATCVIGWNPASTAQAVESRTDKRTLSEHTFAPSEILNQPFTTRSYTMIMGVGASKVKIPSTSDLNLVAYAMQTRVQQPITDRLGVRFNLLGGVFSGTDSDSALIFGADGLWQLGAGAYWNLMESERLSVTANLDLDGGQDYALSPLVAITTAVDEGRVTTEGLLIKTKSFSMRPGVSAAFGINEIVGVFADTAYRLENDNPSIGKTDTNNFFEFGLGLSLNFMSLDIPISMSTSYLRDQALGGDEISTDAFEIGVFYAPNINFAFGLTTRGDIQHLDDDDVDINTWSGILGMTYYH